jgi:single-strand DNA-binding protein
MKAQGLARIGRDAELRRTPNGDAVLSLALAFTYGRKGDDGNRPTQWVEAALWGKRGETLAQYLVKGSQVVAYLEDVHIQTYEGKNGTASKLVAKVADLELVGGSAPKQAAPAPKPKPQPKASAGFDDMDTDSIPF